MKSTWLTVLLMATLGWIAAPTAMDANPALGEPPAADSPRLWAALTLSAAEQRQEDREQREEEAQEREEEAQEREEELYQHGAEALDEKRWQAALEAFEQVAALKGGRSDGALYWKAYAQNKLGRRSEALASLAELSKAYSASRWVGDAKALEVEIRQAAGRPVAPESESNEELKLIALNSLLNVDPQQAVPMLEKFLQGHQAPKLKERALFVLSQSDSPRALEILARTARGEANPDLQRKAVEYLGLFGNGQSQELLAQVYASSGDPAIKRAVLRSFMVAGATDRLFAIAKSEKSVELRKDAIQQLGVSDAQSQLWQLYQIEPSLDVKEQILHALFLADNVDRLVEVARGDPEPRLRKAAIHSLGLQGSQQASEALISTYAKEPDSELKRQILQALFIQDNAKGLIEIARKETNPELKREAVKKLSLMDDRAASDFLLELLNQ